MNKRGRKMKFNSIQKKSLAVIFFTFALCFLMTNNSSAEIEWQREFGVMVDGEYMSGAYLGGVSYGMTYGKVTFCDEDNDGDYDAFLVGITHENWVAGLIHFRNDGTPSSPEWTLLYEDYGIIDGINPWSTPNFCDIDNDGDQDMFVGETMYGAIHLYRNIGTANSPNWILETDDYIDGRHGMIEFCDIDGDGDYDMFIGGYKKLYYYRNDGTPYVPFWTFVTDNYADILNYIGHTDSVIPEFCDIDNDGDFDLFIGENAGNINFFRNDGNVNSSFWTFVTEDYGALMEGGESAPEFCDIDNDGDFDLFLDHDDGKIKFYRNEGTPNDATWSLMATSYFYIDVEDYSHPAFCDIDGDSDYDMFILGVARGLYFYQNNGTLHSPSWFLKSDEYNGVGRVDSTGYFTCVSFCDIDNDGDFDMFVGRYNYGATREIWFYRNDGTSNSPDWILVTKEYIPLLSISGIAFCDIDNDEDYDLFLGVGNFIYFYRNDGTPNEPAWTFVTDDYISSNGYTVVPSFIDVDNDGDYDLFIGQSYGGGISFYRNDGTPEEPLWIFITAYYNWLYNHWLFGVPAFCDIDSDSDYDMFIGGLEGGITFWRNMTIVNREPVATITSISPSPAYEGDTVEFVGEATDPDPGDVIAAYKWTSDIDGLLNEEATFTTDTLSLGTHIISFEAQDGRGEWSEPATETLIVKPEYELSLQDGETVFGDVYVSMTYRGVPLRWFYFRVDGQYTRYNPWRTQCFLNGEHTVQGWHYKWRGRKWYRTSPITVIVSNETSYAPEIISPTEGAELSGYATISFKADGPRPFFAKIYANDKIIGWKFLYRRPTPYNYIWRTTSIPYGEYDLKVVVYYRYAGYTSSAPVSVAVNNVEIETDCPDPASGTVNVHISGNDNSNLYFCILYADWEYVGYYWYMPCDISWDTTSFTNGVHTLHISVYHGQLNRWIYTEKTVEVQN
jgi:hypothetical protein